VIYILYITIIRPIDERRRIRDEIVSGCIFIWVDLILGMWLGYAISRYGMLIVSALNVTYRWVEDYFLLESLEWLNHSPFGIKLNLHLTRKISDILSFIITKYREIVLYARVVEQPVCRLLAYFGIFGLTSQIMLAIDLLRLYTIHIAIIHRILAIQHHFLIEVIKSLWLLLTGQKRNILRRRFDTFDYDDKYDYNTSIPITLPLFHNRVTYYRFA